MYSWPFSDDGEGGSAAEGVRNVGRNYGEEWVALKRGVQAQLMQCNTQERRPCVRRFDEEQVRVGRINDQDSGVDIKLRRRRTRMKAL